MPSAVRNTSRRYARDGFALAALNTALYVQMEDMISEKVDQKEAELHATYDERLRNYEDR